MTERFEIIFEDVLDRIGYENPRPRVYNLRYMPDSMKAYTEEELAATGDWGYYSYAENLIVLRTEVAQESGVTVWHEMAHALLGPNEEHSARFRRLEKLLWTTAKEYLGLDPTWGTDHSCEQADQQGRTLRKGEVGEGKGYPIAWMYGTFYDGDGDGIVCER